MAEIRFKNLPLLLGSMEQKGWIIDSFYFEYKNEIYIVILKKYSEQERKPHPHARVKLEFIRANDITDSIFAYADFYEVRFNTVCEFADFFGIKPSDGNRNLFVDFSEIFATFIPSEKVENNEDPVLIKVQGSRCEGNNPNAIYCYDVRRNGTREDGQPNQRSIANSNKAMTLRRNLFEKYSNDLNLSFFFSENPDDERSDEEIMEIVARRR